MRHLQHVVLSFLFGTVLTSWCPLPSRCRAPSRGRSGWGRSSCRGGRLGGGGAGGATLLLLMKAWVVAHCGVFMMFRSREAGGMHRLEAATWAPHVKAAAVHAWRGAAAATKCATPCCSTLRTASEDRSEEYTDALHRAYGCLEEGGGWKEPHGTWRSVLQLLCTRMYLGVMGNQLSFTPSGYHSCKRRSPPPSLDLWSGDLLQSCACLQAPTNHTWEYQAVAQTPSTTSAIASVLQQHRNRSAAVASLTPPQNGRSNRVVGLRRWDQAEAGGSAAGDVGICSRHVRRVRVVLVITVGLPHSAAALVWQMLRACSRDVLTALLPPPASQPKPAGAVQRLTWGSCRRCLRARCWSHGTGWCVVVGVWGGAWGRCVLLVASRVPTLLLLKSPSKLWTASTPPHTPTTPHSYGSTHTIDSPTQQTYTYKIQPPPRQIHDAIQSEMANIHALSIKAAWTPTQQAAQKQQQPAAAASGAAGGGGGSGTAWCFGSGVLSSERLLLCCTVCFLRIGCADPDPRKRWCCYLVQAAVCSSIKRKKVEKLVNVNTTTEGTSQGAWFGLNMPLQQWVWVCACVCVSIVSTTVLVML